MARAREELLRLEREPHEHRGEQSQPSRGGVIMPAFLPRLKKYLVLHGSLSRLLRKVLLDYGK